MYELDESYGRKAFKTWNAEKSKDLSSEQTSPDDANLDVWDVCSFRELIEGVAFLGAMNKRLALFYRGQSHDSDPLPALFRKSWRAFESTEVFNILEKRDRFWKELLGLGERVFDICNESELGLPRWRGLRDIREAQWAVIQHYEIWPTPLLDLTSNLRVAASFAMGFTRATPVAPKTGYLFVAGMPHSTGSISYDIDQHVVLARLQSVCPPIAKRPHYQDGFLVGRFPVYEPDDKVAEKSSLLRRLVAKFRLNDSGKFWDDDFLPIACSALLPPDDPLRDRFSEEFGPRGADPVCRRAQLILSRE